MVSNGYNFMWFQLVSNIKLSVESQCLCLPNTCYTHNFVHVLTLMNLQKWTDSHPPESFGGNGGRDGFSPRTYTNMCSVSVQEQAGKSKRSLRNYARVFLWFKIDGPSRRRFVFSNKFPERICAKPFVWTCQLRCIHMYIYIYPNGKPVHSLGWPPCWVVHRRTDVTILGFWSTSRTCQIGTGIALVFWINKEFTESDHWRAA